MTHTPSQTNITSYIVSRRSIPYRQRVLMMKSFKRAVEVYADQTASANESIVESPHINVRASETHRVARQNDFPVKSIFTTVVVHIHMYSSSIQREYQSYYT